MAQIKTSLRHAARAEMRRALITPRFPAAAVMVTVLWYLNARRFNESEDVLYIVINTWGRSIVTLLEMVIAAFPYATAFSEDFEHHLLRYCVLRESVWQYTIAKMNACFLSGFAVIFVGENLFFLEELHRLPLVAANSLAAENFSGMNIFGSLLPSHAVSYIELQFLLDSLLVASLTCLALALSVWIRYRYGTFVLPFLIYFILLDVLGSAAIPKYLDITSYFLVFNSQSMTEPAGSMQLICAFILSFVIVLLSGLLLHYKMKREL